MTIIVAAFPSDPCSYFPSIQVGCTLQKEQILRNGGEKGPISQETTTENRDFHLILASGCIHAPPPPPTPTTHMYVPSEWRRVALCSTSLIEVTSRIIYHTTREAEHEVPGTMLPGQSDCPPSADRRTGGRAGLLTNDSACTTMCPLRLRLNAGLFRHQSFNLAKARRGSRRRGRRRSIVVPTHTLYTIILLSWCVVGKDILLSIFNTQCRGKKRES